nr:RNA-directed DNA polymerase, eukaryota [Tanacetum cinerariifolium]
CNGGFEKLVEYTWNVAPVDESNAMINLMKKLKYLKEKIRIWNIDKKKTSKINKISFKAELAELDAVIDKGEGSSLHLSHLFYADDVVFVGKWGDSNIDTIVHVLDCFNRASRFHINMSKSKLLGISMDNDKFDHAALKISCAILKTPFSYLGLKVGGLLSRIQSSNEIVDHMVARFSKWNMKTLSIDGRLTLLKSVLGSMLIYNMSIFKVPMKGEYVFWEDVWRGDVALKHMYPRLYALESCKNADVATKMSHSSLDYYFRRVPRGGVEQAQFVALLAKVEGVSLVNIRDRWVWSLEGSGDFSVASVRKLIDDKMLPKVSLKTH